MVKRMVKGKKNIIINNLKNIKPKLNFLFNFLFFFNFLSLNCSNYELFLENNLKETVSFFEKNEDTLQYLTEKFIQQNKFDYLRRYKTDDILSYTFKTTLNKEKGYRIEITLSPQSNENIWQEESKNIFVLEGADTTKVTLDVILNRNNIDYSNLIYWMNVLNQYNFKLIGKSLSFDNTIEFMLNSDGRLVYSIDPNNNLKEIKSNSEICKRINNRWYYYFSRSSAGFF